METGGESEGLPRTFCGFSVVSLVGHCSYKVNLHDAKREERRLGELPMITPVPDSGAGMLMLQSGHGEEMKIWVSRRGRRRKVEAEIKKGILESGK